MSTVSNLNPSSIELELGLGFDNMEQIHTYDLFNGKNWHKQSALQSVAIFDVAGGAALQVVRECPRRC